MAGYSDDEFGIPGIPSGKTTGSPSKDADDQVKSGNTAALDHPNFFRGQGGLPIQVDDDEFNGDISPTVTVVLCYLRSMTEVIYKAVCKI